MLARRFEKMQKVLALSQFDLTVCLENVHDPHNISAVMRSCDAVGIREIYIIYADSNLYDQPFAPGKRSSSGSNKWVEAHVFRNPQVCFDRLKSKYGRILTTHLGVEATDLYAMDLTGPAALLFGNEKDGLSEEAMANSDGNFVIPQMGMVPSLNISVACAVSLFEAYRQRKMAGQYQEHIPLTPEKSAFLDRLVEAHKNKNRK